MLVTTTPQIMITTAITGGNEDLFPGILSLYVPLGSSIADVTYGNGVFWKRVDVSSYSLYKYDIQNGVDARCIPHGDASLDCVVLDPPYIYSPKGTIKRSISVSYALNAEKGGELMKTQADVLNLYRECAVEARRVLRKDGVLIVKTKDTIQSGKQFWMHTELMKIDGFTCEDLFVLVQSSIPAMDPKWGEQKHARKNHSFFLVMKKIK